MAVEFMLGACAGALAYAAIQGAFAARAKRKAAKNLHAADRLLKERGLSYAWYDAETGNDDAEIADALLLVGTESDRVIVTSSGYLVGAFNPTESLHVAAKMTNTIAKERPKLRLVVSNDNPT